MIDSITEEAGATLDLRRSGRWVMPAKRLEDAEPPHSAEAEQGVLGCLLWQADLVADCQRRLVTGSGLSPQPFYDLRHQTIYDAMVRLKKFDLITLQQHLKDRGELDQVGGIAYLSSLQDSVPSAANLSWYLDLMNEKTKLRNLITTCRAVASRAANHSGDMGELLWSAQSDLVSMLGALDGERSSEAWNLGDLSDYETGNDPNCILGVRDGKTTRYLCRGHGAWLIGPSGVGKSSLSVQQSILWATGTDFCGIAPVRPLRVLIVQAENDIGDAAEQVQGITRAMGIAEFGSTGHLFAQVRDNVRFVTERRTVGQKFALWLERQIVGHRADIVVIDPLLSFAGIDVSRQDQCTNFLRSVLNPVLADTGAVLIGAHHTGKPKAAKDTANWTVYDHAYAGIGSSELVNWARAISVLVPLEHGKFELRLAKRGQRAGATHPNGERTTSLYLQHAARRIHWEQINPPEEAESEPGKAGRPSVVEEVLALGLGPVLDSLVALVSATELEGRIEAFCASRRLDVSATSCRRVVKQLVANGAVVKDGKGYRKP